MASIALFVEIVDVLVSASQIHHLLPGVAGAIQRLHQRDVPVIAISDRLGLDAETAQLYADKLRTMVTEAGTEIKDVIITTAASPASWIKPRPGLLLTAARTHGIDLPGSWMIGTNSDDARAAGQAGCAGVVLVGHAALPTEDLGIVVAQAQDLADAPRVMIPRDGGCWHQL